MRYTHTDHLTGSALVTDAVGTQVQLLDYHPFGTQRINEQTTDYNIKRKFAGHEYDEDLALSYMLARYYNPSTGTFLSQDPGEWGQVFTFYFMYLQEKVKGKDLTPKGARTRLTSASMRSGRQSPSFRRSV